MPQTSSALASHEPQQATLTIRPEGVFKVLLAVLITIVFLGGVANTLIYQTLQDPDSAGGRALRRIDIGHEPSLVQWYSSMLLGSIAVLLGSIGLSRNAKGLPDVRYWMLLAGGFAVLSIDESIMLHEMGNRAVHYVTPTQGIFYFAWVIPGLTVALVSLLLLLKFLGRLDRATRRRYILAGVVFVGGAIGVEMISGIVAENWLEELPSGQFQSRTPWGMTAMTICQVTEEGLELLGASIFLVATLDRIIRIEGGLRICGSKIAL